MKKYTIIYRTGFGGQGPPMVADRDKIKSDGKETEIEIDEQQRQLILLALAELSNRNPKWESHLGALAMMFPDGFEVFEIFRKTEIEFTLESLAKIADSK